MDIGLFVLRLVVGGLFAGHGAQKLWGLYGGAGIDKTAAFFESLGLRPGRLHARAAGTAELVGGFCIAIGLFTPIAAMVVIAVMTTAIITVHFANGLWVTQQGYEYNLVLVAVAFALAGVGAGSISFDSAFGMDMSGTGWAFAALLIGVAAGYGAVVAGRHEPAGVRPRGVHPHPQ